MSANPSTTAANDGRRIELPGADLRWWGAAFDGAEADATFQALRTGIDWQSEEIVLFGRSHVVPRLVAWHGDADAAYTYSGTLHVPSPWAPLLARLRDRVEQLTAHRYNSVLLNLYRGGRDGMGWHADDEPELGPEPAIASVSFGATRRFVLRHRRRRDQRLALDLGHGDVLLMAGTTQHQYLHSLPKTARPAGERINLTFRQVMRGGVVD
jgi:alkylated DNA repair dioxygenase AlkB